MIKEFYREFKKGMEGFGENIAAVVNTIFLSIVYFLGIGIVALGARIIGKKFLEVKPEEKRKTYWEDLDYTNKKEEYYRQF
jgi:hypothetical protein